MKLYITRINALGGIRSTAQYIQEKTAEIAFQLGCREMGIYCYNASAENAESLNVRVDGIIAGISAGDVVIFQLPTWNVLRFEWELLNHIKAYRGRVIIFIHDIEALAIESSRFMLQETVSLYNQAEVLIIPSYAMRDFLLENGLRKDMKFVVQEIWDYPTDIYFEGLPKLKREIHFAGDPGKFIFPNEWDFEIPLKLYTSEPCMGSNVQLMGWMNPSALLLELAKGGFGLVWYGDENWRQYMRYNNNTKLSTYLAAGIPIIVPRGISNQYLIEKNHLGLVVDSLDEAVEKVNKMREEEYDEYVRHVEKFAVLLRNGYFTKKLLIEAIHLAFRKDIG